MFGPAFEAFFSDRGESAGTMTRTSAINAVVGFAAISAFFSIFAFYAGFLQAQNAAYNAAPDMFQDETPAPDYVPLKARNELHPKTCAGGYGWGGHMGPAADVFCHPSLADGPQAAPRRVAAYAGSASPGAPRTTKPRRAIDNAVASSIARAAGLSRTQKTAAPDALARALEPKSKEAKDLGAPTLPGEIGLGHLSPGFLNIGGLGEPPAGEDFPTITRPDTAPPNNTPPGDEPPAGENPPTDTPPDSEEPPQTPEEPDMPLPPLDPVDPDPIGPIDPSDPGGPTDPVDPTVVPLPGALLLWLPGLAALALAGQRRRRA